MDEERQQSFYAPKKLFKKRIRESSESDDWSVFNSFTDSLSSIYVNFINDSASSSSSSLPTSYIGDNLDLSTDRLSNSFDIDDFTFEPVYTNLKPAPEINYKLDFIAENRINDWNYSENLQGKKFLRYNKPDPSFIKTEVDYCPCNGQNNFAGNTLNGYKSYTVPQSQDFRTPYSENKTEALNLTLDKSEKYPIKSGLPREEIIKKTILEKGSPFVHKFFLQETLKSYTRDEKQILHPFHVSSIATGENFKEPFTLSKIKTEVMDTSTDTRQNLATDISLHHITPVSKPFQNRISSSNFKFESDSNSRISPSQTVCDEDLDNLIDSEILKTSFPLDSVNAMSSMKGNTSTEVSPQKKHGKKWMKGDMICQVCGDKAAGFYCGAFACEACKKFFMRSCRNDKTKYVCLRDKKCQITAESRVQCQYCRLQKCLTLNMYSPGSDVRKENVGDIPCRVCSAPSSGFHFGALTCEGCKGFFRRMAKERELGKYRCSKTGACEINTSTRNLCKSCRYKKCIDAGMSIEGSRIGRQPNAVKYAISLEVKNQSGTKLEVDDKPGFTLEDLNNSIVQPEFETPESVQTKRPMGKNTEEIEGPSPQKIVKTTFDTKAVTNYEVTLKWIKQCDEDLKVVQLPRKDTRKNLLLLTDVVEIWEETVNPFYYHSSVIIKYAKKCRPFRKLPIEDQVRMLQQAIYPIVVLNHSRYYILETREYSYFGWSADEREHIWKYFPFYRILGEHFKNTGDNVKLLGMDDDEFTILSTLVLLNPDVPGLTDKERVRQLQAEILDFLEYHLSVHYPNQPSRYGLILVRLSELNFYAYQHVEGIQEMLRVYPYLKMPQLYREMFINM